MGRYVDLDVPDDTIGIAALREIRARGPARHQLGVVLAHDDVIPLQDQRPPVVRGDRPVGRMTANAWSPRLERNIGLCLVSSAVAPGEAVTVTLEDGTRVSGEVCGLPFL